MLLPVELRARLERLSLVARRRVRAQWAGRHGSHHKGESLDFADYREYVPGDDFRRIDHWRMSDSSDASRPLCATENGHGRRVLAVEDPIMVIRTEPSITRDLPSGSWWGTGDPDGGIPSGLFSRTFSVGKQRCRAACWR